MFRQMSSFFEDIFSKHQCCFKKGFSTQQCLLTFLTKWKNADFWGSTNRSFQDICLPHDDDRRLVASDVTAYVHKNQYRVVQFPFKVRISKTDYVKRIIGDKPV